MRMTSRRSPPLPRLPGLRRLAWRTRLLAPLRGQVLEIGCGDGVNFRRYDPSCQVWAIEPDPDRAAAAAIAAWSAAAVIRLYQARAEELPFPDHSFDHVLVCLVLCSVSDPQAALTEIQRVLRPPGSLVLLEHVRPRSPALAWVADRVTPAWSRHLHNCHLNRDTETALARLGWRTEVRVRRACVVRGIYRPPARPSSDGYTTNGSRN